MLPPNLNVFRIAALLVVAGSFSACATHDGVVAADLEPGRLPAPNTTLAIAGLGPCTDNPDRSWRLDAAQPVHVLVHGCFGSSGQFRALAQVLAFHGQQSACFTYDDRARLDDSAAELRRALGQLAAASSVPQITVIGHSQGALVARRALTDVPLPVALPKPELDLRLVTVSGPFSGIAAARTCGRQWLYPLSLGLLPLSCYAFTGPKWADITESSPFIAEPGPLAQQVRGHLKIDTDERGTCRRDEAERCVASDDIFSLDEQRHAPVEADSRVKRLQINAGHVEIVGDKRVAPTKLIAALQQEGVLRPTAPERLSALGVLMMQLYGSLGGEPAPAR
jgi:pimeloyl-ACP methyl ester carboxylesterase